MKIESRHLRFSQAWKRRQDKELAWTNQYLRVEFNKLYLRGFGHSTKITLCQSTYTIILITASELGSSWLISEDGTASLHLSWHMIRAILASVSEGYSEWGNSAADHSDSAGGPDSLSAQRIGDRISEVLRGIMMLTNLVLAGFLWWDSLPIAQYHESSIIQPLRRTHIMGSSIPRIRIAIGESSWKHVPKLRTNAIFEIAAERFVMQSFR